MKILTVLGARPQFIKAAAISRSIKVHNSEVQHSIDEVIVHTGQHYDSKMSSVFFVEMNIPKPDYRLDCGNLNHGAMTGRMVEKIEDIILQEKPNIVLVYGDTNSTLAASLAASKHQIVLAHVEAGLRSFNMSMPEEINRILTDRISNLLFCPTSTAVQNLTKEGYPFPIYKSNKQRIFNVGDVMYDTTLFYSEKARESIHLNKWNITDYEYALCTIHRAENTNDVKKLRSIFTALKEINNHLKVVIPLHPRTKRILQDKNCYDLIDEITVLEPLSYLEIQRLEMGARVIITDSGGMQKEAFFHNVPCVTLRDETEWIETIDVKANKLVGTDVTSIVEASTNLSWNKKSEISIYGNGDTSSKIINLILDSIDG